MIATYYCGDRIVGGYAAAISLPSINDAIEMNGKRYKVTGVVKDNRFHPASFIIYMLPLEYFTEVKPRQKPDDYKSSGAGWDRAGKVWG
jgi:hypothetical protein